MTTEDCEAVGFTGEGRCIEPATEGRFCIYHAPRPLPLHRTEAGYPRCATCDGGGCLDCTDPA